VLLAAVPLGFVLALLARAAFGLSLHQAVAAGAAFGAVVLADALFFHPPVDGKRQ
jgi:hypothetical protein